MRPEGFVGRAFVQREHAALDLPPRLQDWQEEHVLIALAKRGEDCIGDLIVGDESLARYFRGTAEASAPVPAAEVTVVYPRMAQEAIDGDPAGSSAGGEQPKFAVLVDRGGYLQHVLVKFSPFVNTEEGRRWADLLICEHHALETIKDDGRDAATTRIYEAGGRVFLEVDRFDRVGEFGRVSVAPLSALEDEYYGHRDNWVNAAGRMETGGHLSSEDADHLRWLSVFGDLIANSDQHFGNISLFVEDDHFTIAPAYDMLPMLYRPREGAGVPEFKPVAATGSGFMAWPSAQARAVDFWRRASEDNRISEEFRALCRENQEKVARLARRPRLLRA